MKRWSTTAGSALAILIMGIVLYLYGGDLRNVDFTNSNLVPKLAGSVAIYVLVMLIAAFGWKILLGAFGAMPARSVAERQFLISQIGKYVPGNVAQYLGRAAMTINSGVPARIVGIALVTETAAIVMGGFLSVAASVALAPELAGNLQNVLPDKSGVIWLSVVVAAFMILLFGASLASAILKLRLPTARFGSVIAATILYTIAFLLLGVSLHLIVSSLSSVPVPVSLSVAVFAAAWIAGVATPGAPGGLGVRESVLTLGLASVMGGPAALSAALLHRGVSVLGDVISFGLGLLLPKMVRAPITPEHTE